ncbi:MAG: hypothetical protein LBH31_05990, partial [Burkholderiaceae bacterium]|nr:hypothetical protein [Burkholderiaceae bacterium]
MKKQFWGLTWKLTLPAGVLLLAASLSVQAASSFDLRSKRGSGNSAEYAWDGTVLTVKDRANIIITGAVTDGTRIEVAAGATAAITLNGVSISGLKTGSRLGGTVDYFTHKKTFADIGLGPNQSPLALNSGAKVKLKIQGTNTLTAGDCANYKASVCAGITVPDSAALDIDGTDALTATGGWRGAGIGGVNRGNGGAGGAITIRGGTVTANAGRFGGSGIGSGSGDSITIRSGTVTANGSEDGGPGIGCYGGTITISGGTVVVHGGGISGQGIGGAVGGSIGAGNRMDSISDGKDLMITISGGTVTAYGSGEGAGIGGTI